MRTILKKHRWKLSLVLIDSFLSAFSPEPTQRKELMTALADNYKKEFGFMNHNTKKQLDNKFRTYCKEIENALLHKNEIVEILEIIKVRRQVIFPIAAINHHG